MDALRMVLAITALSLLAPIAMANDPTADWASVLERYVDDDGRIDFHALEGDREPLDRYVAWIARHGPQSTPAQFPDREASLAYHVNAYNALAMHGVLARGIPDDFGSFFKRARFFRFRGIVVDGRKTNLYDYENDVIRPLGDARVHFALNCMVRDCPRLPREPFDAGRLDAQLEAATYEFLNSEKYVRIDEAQRVVHLSAIFDFYTEDFVASGRAEDLPAYLNRYRDTKIATDQEVRFMDYDWTVNIIP